MTASPRLVERCRKLGLGCDEVQTDRVSSPLAALACFPMYMVANVHAWTGDKQWRVPLVDLPGSEHIREAFAIGKQESALDIAKEHRRVLGTLVSNSKPSDLVIYEYAIETLKGFLAELTAPVAETIRTAIARTIVQVANASGEGFLGSGPKVSPEERDCIAMISRELSLQSSAPASAILKDI